MDNTQHLIPLIAGFVVISLASKQIGDLFSRARLPLISGFIFTGIIAGPFVLDLIHAEALEGLRFVDEFSLAFIAFAAGSELYLKELHSRLKSIIWVTAGNAFAIPMLGGLTLFFLSGFIPFMQSMPVLSRLAISFLAGSILVARSPSSAIAIVNELRARGPFTQTVLGVTMITDVVVIFLFAFSSSVASAVLTVAGLDITFVVLLLVELLLSLMLGYIVGRILEFVLLSHFGRFFKTATVLLSGYGVFVFSESVRHTSHAYLSFELFLEPLLVCMVASFIVTNYSPYRQEFLQILADAGPPVYILFFTLTGASLALDILVDTLPVALALFAIRLAAIFAGSFGGGLAARDPAHHNRLGWLAYITQAGVGLGLAKEVMVEFPAWGADFATMIIAVIVLSQLIGPPLFKWAVSRAGEAHPRAAAPEFDGQQDAIIFGLEGQSLALAQQLEAHGWHVKIVTRLKNYSEALPASADFNVVECSRIDLDFLHHLETEKADAIVALMSDELNYRLCELVYEHFGIKTVVVRLNHRSNREQFRQLGALIVDPATAVVSLYDHLVRSPSTASLLLGLDNGQDIVDLEVHNPNLHGLALRELRLPLDTLVLSVYRKGRLLISHGYTRLKIGDRVTILGSPESLEQLRLRFDA